MIQEELREALERLLFELNSEYDATNVYRESRTNQV